MKIAYCSPFNPIKSGISDFSEELVMKLKDYAYIDLFYNEKPSNKKINENFNFYNIDSLNDYDFRNQYDIIVYHMGNNVNYHKCIADFYFKYPGILELHDFSLHNYLAGDKYLKNKLEEYLECIKYCHGENGVRTVQRFLDGNAGAPWESHALELTANKHYIDIAKGIIVHSDMAKQMVKGIRPSVPVINIPLHTPDIIEKFEQNKRLAKEKLNIDNDILVFGSFGYATRAKRIYEILEALALYKKKEIHDFCFFIVGKVDGIDINEKIIQLKLEKQVVITGYTDLEEFKTYMSACDVCINLRYPTHGESSASLHRMLGMGKPVIVSKIGTFEEYPDDIVYQVSYNENEVKDVYNALINLTDDMDKLQLIGKKAINYAKENFDLYNNIKLYMHFFDGISKGTYIEENELDAFIDILFELDLTEDNYIDHVITKMI